MRNKKLDLSRAPYRGVVSEIAREQGVAVQSIWAAIHEFRNPRIMAILEKKIGQRERLIARVEARVGFAE